MSETLETVETTESVETEAKPVKIEKVTTKPKIRDSDDAILELRRENEKLRKTLEEQAVVRAEELSDQKLEALRAETEEKATAKAERLVEKMRIEIAEESKAKLAKSELRAFALKAGVVDFDDLYDILKRSDLAKIEFDDDGDVKNASAIIADMKTKKPHLFAGVNTASTERAPVTRETVVDDRPALKMSREEYERGKRSLNRM